MKPIKNRIYCVAANRPKMQFATEKKALNFIKFNSEEIRLEKGYAPTRAYYCEFCCCWHVSSKNNAESVSYYEKRDKERSKYYAMSQSDRAISMQEKADILIAEMEQALFIGNIEFLDNLLMRYDKLKLRYNLTFKNQLNKPRAEELRMLKNHVEAIADIPWENRAEVINQLPVDIRDIVIQSAANHDFILIVKKVIASLKLSAHEEGVDAAHKFKKSVKFCRSMIDKISGPYCEGLKQDLRQQVNKIKSDRYRILFGSSKAA